MQVATVNSSYTLATAGAPVGRLVRHLAVWVWWTCFRELPGE